MRDKRAKVEAAALALVKDSNHDDEVFVVNFNDEAFLDLPHGKDFTNNIKELEEALTRIDSRGGTAMRDAIRMSIDHLKEKAKKDKKVLVVVTDGNDNSSVISLENLVKASQQSEVLIYSMGLLSEEERREAKRAERALNDLALATGGESFFPKEVFGSGAHRPYGGARHPQPVHHPVHADEPGDGRLLPRDQGDGEGIREVRRPARATATTPRRTRIRRQRARPRSNNAGSPLAPDPRLPAGAVAQSRTCGGESKPTGECTRSGSRFASSGNSAWKHRRELVRYLRWTGRMRQRA